MLAILVLDDPRLFDIRECEGIEHSFVVAFVKHGGQLGWVVWVVNSSPGGMCT